MALNSRPVATITQNDDNTITRQIKNCCWEEADSKRLKRNGIDSPGESSNDSDMEYTMAKEQACQEMRRRDVPNPVGLDKATCLPRWNTQEKMGNKNVESRVQMNRLESEFLIVSRAFGDRLLEQSETTMMAELKVWQWFKKSSNLSSRKVYVATRAGEAESQGFEVPDSFSEVHVLTFYEDGACNLEVGGNFGNEGVTIIEGYTPFVEMTIGIDVGICECRVALWRDSKVELLQNPRRQSMMPSYVLFQGDTPSTSVIDDSYHQPLELLFGSAISNVERLIAEKGVLELHFLGIVTKENNFDVDVTIIVVIALGKTLRNPPLDKV
ncbi:hypothetical protein SUGI_0979920 [Cryptomeria japonica]|nr:hypothetical protein SUGI_0979920 [Cryptomeria japonica]